MKKIVLVLIFLGIISCQQEKIGFVDNVKLMDTYKEKVDIEAKFKSRSEAFGKKRDSISQAFQLEAQDFQSRAQKLAQAKAQEEYGQLQERSQFIGLQLQQEEQQLQMQGQTEMDSLVSKVKREIKAYGKANGYSFILSGGDGGNVLYGTDAHNVTDEIVKILNDNYNK